MYGQDKSELNNEMTNEDNHPLKKSLKSEVFKVVNFLLKNNVFTFSFILRKK